MLMRLRPMCCDRIGDAAMTAITHLRWQRESAAERQGVFDGTASMPRARRENRQEPRGCCADRGFDPS